MTTGYKNTSAARALVEILLQRWPNHRKDHAQLRMYLDEITDLVEERGEAPVRAAVSAARTRCHFLPESAELRDLLPAAEQFPQHRDPDCRECMGSGMKLIEVPADQRHRELHPGAKTMRLAQRCHCEPPAARTNDSVLEVGNAS